MVISCGIDAEETGRFDKFHEGDPVFINLVKDVFTVREITINSKCKEEHAFTTGFACKEAVRKALGSVDDINKTDWREIEFLFSTDKDKQQIELHGMTRQIFHKHQGKSIRFQYYKKYGNMIFEVVLLDE